MKYEMRSLQASDIFSVVKILNGIGLNNVKEAIDIEEINNIRKRMAEDNSEDNSEGSNKKSSESLEIIIEELKDQIEKLKARVSFLEKTIVDNMNP